jgi:energy-converting hydrogenase Eha subunit H
MVLTYFPNDFEMVPVAPIITGITQFIIIIIIIIIIYMVIVNPFQPKKILEPKKNLGHRKSNFHVSCD